MERAARRCRNGAVTASLPASVEDTSLPAIISRYSDDLTSLLIPAVAVLVVALVIHRVSDVAYLWSQCDRHFVGLGQFVVLCVVKW